MADRDKKGYNLTKMEKIKELMSMKNEDVEFSGALADKDDVEAIRRSEAADERQIKKMDNGWTS
ncbi:YfhD family protein [Paenibacillus sp.]|uniref:YfhD family protein n=1 Tax=Paenibacillus sp. TaxID=58172 RepID=UPI0035CCD853